MSQAEAIKVPNVEMCVNECGKRSDVEAGMTILTVRADVLKGFLNPRLEVLRLCKMIGQETRTTGGGLAEGQVIQPRPTSASTSTLSPTFSLQLSRST